jgi:hypothetical protein
MGPPPEPRGPYDAATDINTNPKFLTDPRTGKPVLGDGVTVNLDGLTGYSGNLDQIQMNFMGLSRSVTGELHGLIQSAFPAGAEHGFAWTSYMNRLASHNAGQLEIFFGGISTGIRNVASAAQTVANAYHNTDLNEAANMNAILYAFGERETPPPGIPQWIAKQIPTWNDFKKDNPGAGVVIPENGIPPENIKRETSGNTTTLTITLPQGGTVVVTTTTWSTYPGGPSGQTETTTVNGRKLETISTSTVGSVTTKTTTQSIYDEKGKHVRDQVASEDRETWSVDGTVVRTDTSETNYTYDGKGNRVDTSTTEQSNAVGYDPTEPVMDPEDDPALQELERLSPEPEAPETVILAPGEFGQDGQQSPSTGTVA